MDTTNQLPDNHRTPLPSVDANIATDGTLKVAYLMSRFPKLTETFVLFEILAVQQQGVQVEVFPLLRGRGSDRSVAGAGIWQKLAEYLQPRKVEPAMHREASPLVEQAHYEPFVSWPILKSNVAMLSTRPGRYVGLVSRLIRGNLGSANRLLGSLALLPKMVHFARRMQSLGVDHVHAHFANHPATAAFVIHYLTGIPYSFTPHGSDLHRDQRMLRDKVADASFVVAISKYNGQFIREHCGEVATNKIRLLHCGVDRNVFCRVRRPDQAAGRNLQVLCIGTLHEVKGQQWILRAMADEDSPPMDLHLVGDGPDRDALTALAQDLGIAGRVRFYGQQTRPELLETLGRCDVLVAPSVPTADGRREGIPVVLMEAMASGLPVVASRLSGIPELVVDQQTGLLVPPGDYKSIARALRRLFDEPQLRRQLSDAARQRIAAEFDLHRNAARLVAWFQEPSSSHVAPTSMDDHSCSTPTKTTADAAGRTEASPCI